MRDICRMAKSRREKKKGPREGTTGTAPARDDRPNEESEEGTYRLIANEGCLRREGKYGRYHGRLKTSRGLEPPEKNGQVGDSEDVIGTPPQSAG